MTKKEKARDYLGIALFVAFVVGIPVALAVLSTGAGVTENYWRGAD